MSNLFDALNQINAPPCDECPHRLLCANFELACKAFRSYVHAGTRRKVDWNGHVPTRQQFIQLYQEEAA